MQIADEAKAHGMELCQSYARVGSRAEQQVGRYEQARQFRQMRGQLSRLRGWLRRANRDVERKAFDSLPARLDHRLSLAQRRHVQSRAVSDNRYAPHEPEVECVANGRARSPEEFCAKLLVAVTAKENLVVGMRRMPGNPHERHTLPIALEQVATQTATVASIMLADRGYRIEVPENPTKRLFLSQTARLPPAPKRLLKRRQVVEPVIGHRTDDLIVRD